MKKALEGRREWDSRTMESPYYGYFGGFPKPKVAQTCFGFLIGKTTGPDPLILNTETNESEPNPEYENYLRQDQLLASWILSSFSESVLSFVIGLDRAFEIWKYLETSFASQSKARLMQHKFQLQNLKEGTLNLRKYLNKAKACCDALASVGHKLSEEDQVMHVFSGLPSEYNQVIVTKTSAIRLFVSQGIGGPYQRGRGGSNYKGRRAKFYGNNKLVCQVCHIPGHTADRCYYRFDQGYNTNPQNQTAG
ncbi:hypothetical protein DH2020_048862 [Rehmannia glutinosa]|uniref:Uncharacterized protein n=1 Tax=Rehmannia glutinosa TaxID=99300 RepID=A0ABR0U524_REHGL